MSVDTGRGPVGRSSGPEAMDDPRTRSHAVRRVARANQLLSQALIELASVDASVDRDAGLAVQRSLALLSGATQPLGEARRLLGA